MDKILVVIVTYNAMQWAERCFRSLRKSSHMPDIFVVDNGSTDGTQIFIKEHYPEVIFQQSKKNLGFGKANNLGLQYALDNNYDYVYLLNQDAWIMENTIEKLIIISKTHTDYGILSPLQMEANMQHLDNNFKAKVCSWESSPDLLDSILIGPPLEVIQVHSIMAAHWFMTRECILKIGGFSPTFPHYGEDDNYLDRVLFKNIKAGIVPSLKVVHDRENRLINKQKRMYMDYIGFLRFLSKPESLSKKYVTILLNSLRLSIKYKSMKPTHYLIMILMHVSSINRDRKISIESDHAFLAYK